MNSCEAHQYAGTVPCPICRAQQPASDPPKNSEKSIGEAFDTGHSIIVATPYGYTLSAEHNCDAMGCGAWHVLYRFAKASANA